MALCGNHGIIIPRDPELLRRLYWDDGLTLPQMAARFGVTHKSVLNVMVRLGVPTRGKGERPERKVCRDCGIKPPLIVPHKLAKNGTGTRCRDCLRAYKAKWIRIELERNPSLRIKRHADLRRWYLQGAMHPTGELSWIHKSRALLRANKRLLAEMTNHGRSKSRSAASAQAPTSPT